MSCNQNYKNIIIRRGLWTDFRAENPVLKAGEPSYAYNDTNKLYLIKIGDGVTRWRDLPCLPMNCNITTTPAPDGPCFKYDFYHNNGNVYDLAYYDLQLQENNNPIIDSGNFLAGTSSWAFSGISPGPKDAPHVSVNYDKIAPNGLDFQYHKIDLRFMYDSPSGLKNTVYGDTIPLFTMGDYFSTDHASEAELSFNILRTSPVREDGSMSGTIMLYQEPDNVAIGVSGVDIAPSSWYDVMIQREFADYTVKINEQLVMSGDPTFSNLYLGQNLEQNNFLIGNAYPSGGCNSTPTCTSILWIDEFRASKEHCDDSEETTTTVDPCITNEDCPVFVQFFEVDIEPNHIGENNDSNYVTYRTTSEFPISDLEDNDNIQTVDSLIVGWNTKMTVYETTNGIKGNESFSITGPVVLCGLPSATQQHLGINETFIGNDVDGVPYQTKFPIESRDFIETFDHPIGGHDPSLPTAFLQAWMPNHYIIKIESLKTEFDGCGPESNLEVVFNSWS